MKVREAVGLWGGPLGFLAALALLHHGQLLLMQSP